MYFGCVLQGHLSYLQCASAQNPGVAFPTVTPQERLHRGLTSCRADGAWSFGRTSDVAPAMIFLSFNPALLGANVRSMYTRPALKRVFLNESFLFTALKVKGRSSTTPTKAVTMSE